jgi:hypothetical protein
MLRPWVGGTQLETVSTVCALAVLAAAKARRDRVK